MIYQDQDWLNAWLEAPGLSNEEILARLQKKTVERPGPLDTPCWIWRGRRRGGYGVFFRTPQKSGHENWCEKEFVHRLGYQILKGPIPRGMELDHLCEIRSCWCPEHLEIVTPEENAARVFRARPYRPARRLVA